MTSDQIKIHRITEAITSKPEGGKLYVCWIQNEIEGIEIDGNFHNNVSNSIIYLSRNSDWKIFGGKDKDFSGYVMALEPSVLNNSLLSKLHINEIRIFNPSEIPIINLSPGIATRTQAILEMIDELIGSELNHKDEAIHSLLNTFFVYCDGQCNIKSNITENGSKRAIVYSFKKLVNKHLSQYHEVADYADMLNISPKYLNECVKTVLGFTAKGIIAEQLLMQSRHRLKFSDQTIKEISYELGFSSPEYFSSFFKSRTGKTPSSLRTYS